MFKLTPKDDTFYILFSQSADIIYQSAKMLREFVESKDYSDERLRPLKEMERKCDRIVHVTLNQLNQTFLTPFDREDIYALTKEIDNIEDFIETAASRFVMFNVKEYTPDAMKLCEMIEDCTKEIISMMSEFKYMGKSKTLLDIIIEINKIEEDGDAVSRQAIKDLFRNDSDPIDVIKWREIYQHLECTLDACEDVANLVEGIVMKNA